jgi:serine phosphatase RsbU (regulator of sigma subunit)
MAILYIYPVDGEPFKVTLEAERASVGRAPASDIVIADTHCSSCHAFLERAGEGFLIRDAASKNGTFVNDRQIQSPELLSPGDEIRVGNTLLTFDRPRMNKVKIVDGPASATDASAAVPYRTILGRTSGVRPAEAPEAREEDVRDENRSLQIMVQVSEALVAHKPLQELLDDILDLIAGHVPMDQCVVMLRAASGELETRAARIRDDDRGEGEIRISRTVVAMAYERHLSVLLSGPGSDPKVADSFIAKDIRSALCVPIGDSDEVIGVLYADRHGAAEPFRDSDLRMLTLLASTAAIKIREAGRVAELIQAEKVHREIKIAAEIQRDFLPRSVPSCEGYGIAARALPCLQVGGDYYDLIDLGPGRVGLAVADVSGKGVGAALLMASMRAWLRAELRHGTDLKAITEGLNEFIRESSDIHSFITFFFAELEIGTGRIRYVNAGHNPPLLIGPSGPSRELPATGLILGMLPGCAYEVGEESLGPGEVLVLYTDGMTESRNPREEEVGVEGLKGYVLEECRGDAPAILDAVFRGVTKFTACAEPFDDRTLVIVKRNGFESGPSV